MVRLDTAFADPLDNRQMREGFHMGDHLHGNDAGLKSAGDSIDLALFGGKSTSAKKKMTRRAGSSAENLQPIPALVVVAIAVVVVIVASIIPMIVAVIIAPVVTAVCPGDHRAGRCACRRGRSFAWRSRLARDVDIPIPVVANEIHRSRAGVVTAAVPLPVT